MERSSKKIVDLIKKIIVLLEIGEEDYWIRYFHYILGKIDAEETVDVIRTLSQVFKGGMGSFSDTVLHKNGVPLIKENNDLYDLKNQLFDACQEYLR